MSDAPLRAPGAMLMVLMLLGRRLFTVRSRWGTGCKVHTTHTLGSAHSILTIYLYIIFIKVVYTVNLIIITYIIVKKIGANQGFMISSLYNIYIQ